MITIGERAEAILRNLGCPITPVNMRFMIDCLRAAINDKLEEAVIELDKLQQGTYTSAQTPAGLVRAMKVK